MSKDREKSIIQIRAKELLLSGMSGDLTISKSCRVEVPIPVLDPNRSLHSWFVPVTVGQVLAGFFEFQPDQTLIRYSSFQSHQGSLEGCPKAELWTDPKTIKRQIKTQMHPDDKIRELFLTYDRVPARLAWAIVLETPDETTRILYIAGSVVWEANEPDIGENSFGG